MKPNDLTMRAGASVAKLALLVCLLGLATASAFGAVFSVNGTLSDGSVFTGTLTIDTVTPNSTTAITAANITVGPPSSVTCTAFSAQGNFGAFGYYVDLTCNPGAALFQLMMYTPASVNGYMTGYTGGGINYSAVGVSFLTPFNYQVTSGTVSPLVAPTFSKAFGSASIFTGTTTTLTFTIQNGNAAPLSGLGFSDTPLPAGLLVANTPGITNTCGGTVTAVAGSNSISLSGGSVGASTNCTVSVSVAGVAPGTQINTTSTLTSNEAPAASPATATIVVFLALDGSFQVSYAANPSAGESFINIINTGANGAPLLGPGFGGASGNICVNVYAFSPDEQLISCCSCLVTPNGVVNLGVNRNLTVKTLTGVIPTSVVVKLVATLAGAGGTGTSCSNSAADASLPRANGLVAYGTTSQSGSATVGPYNIVEHTFVPSTLSTAERASITGRCAAILGNGSGYGQCPSCTQGALGAGKL